MSSNKKKSETTAEPIQGFEADENHVAQYRAVEHLADGEISANPSAPLAAAPPDILDRVSALELANIELEKRIKEHERYHFGSRI